MTKSHHAAGACGGWRGGGWRGSAGRWKCGGRCGRARVAGAGAGGWCGAAFCVHRWYSVCGRCGRGERARCSARACGAGWGCAAGEMRVGGPHGRGMLLRSCAPCNPARLTTPYTNVMTQILGAVQPRSRGSVPCAGPLLTATGEAGIRRSRFLPLLHCSIKNRFVPSIETKLPNLSIRPPVAFVCLPTGPLILLP